MSFARGKRVFRELAGLCDGSIRTWDERYSEPEMNLIFKIYCVGEVT